VVKKSKRSSGSKKFGLGKWGKMAALVFGSAAIGGIATQYLGISSSITSGGIGYLIGGVPVAIGALAIGMLKNGGGGMGSLTSLLGGQQHQSTPAGTVYG